MRITLLLLLTAVSLCLSAQSRKGSLLLAGDTRANYRAISLASNQFWDVGTSRVGYFLTEDIVLGAELSLRTNIFAFQTPEDFRINPFFRYYISEITSEKMNYFVQLGIGTFGAFTDFGSAANFETDFHVGAGAEYTLAPNLLAEGLIRYNAKAFGLNYTELSLRMNVLIGKTKEQPSNQLLPRDIMFNPSGGNVLLGLRGRESVTHLIADLNLEGGFMVSKHLLFEAGFLVQRDAYRAEEVSFEGRRNRPLITQLRGYVGGRIFLPIDGVHAYAQARISHFSTTTGFDDEFGRRSTTDAAGQLGLGGGAMVFIAENVAIDFGLRRQLAMRQFFLDQWEGSAGLKVFISGD